MYDTACSNSWLVCKPFNQITSWPVLKKNGVTLSQKAGQQPACVVRNWACTRILHCTRAYLLIHSGLHISVPSLAMESRPGSIRLAVGNGRYSSSIISYRNNYRIIPYRCSSVGGDWFSSDHRWSIHHNCEYSLVWFLALFLGHTHYSSKWVWSGNKDSNWFL